LRCASSYVRLLTCAIRRFAGAGNQEIQTMTRVLSNTFREKKKARSSGGAGCNRRHLSGGSPYEESVYFAARWSNMAANWLRDGKSLDRP